MQMTFSDRYGVLLCRTPTHIYLRPHPSLSAYVAHYTLCLGSGTASETPLGALSLLPDAAGCLVFSLGADGALSGRCYGPTTRMVTVTNDLGVHPLRFFVEFHPGGFHAFSPLPQCELADRVLSLFDLDSTLERAVECAWAQAPDLDEFVRGVERLLLARRAPVPGFSALLHTLTAQPSSMSLSALSAATGYSPRHLSRLFRAHAGLGGKSLLRVARANEAARRLRAGVPSLTRLAQELGYFDQSHFIHDFQSVCGVTPGLFQARLSGFYNEPFKF